MRILKIAGIVLAILFAIVIVLGLIAPKKVETARSTVIQAPQEVVFNQVNDLNNWNNWSPWLAADPTAKMVMGEKTVGTGASYSWTSENSGAGTMTITESVPSEHLHTKVDFNGQGEAFAEWTFTPQQGGTNVNWTFSTKFPIPFNIMLLFGNFKSMIEKDYDKGLELLKKAAEEKANATPALPALEVKTEDWPARYYVGLRAVVAIPDIAKQYAENFMKVGAAVKAQKLETVGAPSGMFYTYDEEKQQTDMVVALGVKTKATVKGYSTIEIQAGKVLIIDYYGPYENLGSAHETMDKYMTKNGLKVRYPVIEEYISDPMAEPDSTKWLTKVYYPVE